MAICITLKGYYMDNETLLKLKPQDNGEKQTYALLIAALYEKLSKYYDYSEEVDWASNFYLTGVYKTCSTKEMADIVEESCKAVATTDFRLYGKIYIIYSHVKQCKNPIDESIWEAIKHLEKDILNPSEDINIFNLYEKVIEIVKALSVQYNYKAWQLSDDNKQRLNTYRQIREQIDSSCESLSDVPISPSKPTSTTVTNLFKNK